LACQLFPLGLTRDPDRGQCFVRLEPEEGSRGVYGDSGTIAGYLAGQGVDESLAGTRAYEALLSPMRKRVAELVDFDRIEPREFWRIATREALAESNYDPNPLIDALFDADAVCDPPVTVPSHIAVLAVIMAQSNPAIIAAAGVILAVSLGFSPSEVITVPRG
jgi:hypothetical protein